MATMTVSLPDPMKEWIEAQVQSGDFASASDYFRDLVRKDRVLRQREERERAERERPLTLEELRELLSHAKAGGLSNRTLADIKAEAVRIARERGYLDE